MGGQFSSPSCEDDEVYQITFLTDATPLPQVIKNVLRYADIEHAVEQVSVEERDYINGIGTAIHEYPLMKIVRQNNEIDLISRTNSMLRFLGRYSHLYPSKDAVNASKIDMWMDYNEVLRSNVAETKMSKMMEQLEDETSIYKFVGNMTSISIADICLHTTLSSLDDVDDSFPNVQLYLSHIGKLLEDEDGSEEDEVKKEN